MHSGRWYVVAADVTDGKVRNFRLDRISCPTLRQGTFDLPVAFDAARHVVDGLAGTPRTHTVSVRVYATTEQLRTHVPVGLAIIQDTGEPGWVRLRLHAERLGWIPAMLAGLGQPFIVEQPSALRDQIRALARRLEQYAEKFDGTKKDGATKDGTT